MRLLSEFASSWWQGQPEAGAGDKYCCSDEEGPTPMVQILQQYCTCPLDLQSEELCRSPGNSSVSSVTVS